MSAAPGQSTGGASLTRDDETVHVSTKSSTAAPLSAQKIDCQDEKCSSAPEPSIPRAPPEPATPAQMPTALVRSAGGYAAVSNDNVAGMMNAAPSPAAARAAMIWTGLSNTSGAIDATANTASPVSSAPRLPYRSPIAPAGSSRHASTSV